MTSNLHMKNRNIVNLGDPSDATHAINKKYVDIIANNILSGSETLQGDIKINNNRIKSLHTHTSNNDAIKIR